MNDTWLFYGGLTLIVVIYTLLLIMIFWRIGFNRGYDEGKAVTRREFRQKHRKWESNNFNYDIVRITPYQARKMNKPIKQDIYINRSLR